MLVRMLLFYVQKLKKELVGLEDDEARAFLDDLGVAESGLEQIIQKSF